MPDPVHELCIRQLLSVKQQLWAVYRDVSLNPTIEPVEAWGLLDSGSHAVPMVAIANALVPADCEVTRSSIGEFVGVVASRVDPPRSVENAAEKAAVKGCKA